MLIMFYNPKYKEQNNTKYLHLKHIQISMVKEKKIEVIVTAEKIMSFDHY